LKEKKCFEGKRAQITVEYLVLTAFIMLAVAIIFAFAFVNYSENLRVAKAGESMTKISDVINEVYSTGKGNVKFITVSFPDGMSNVRIIHRCYYGPNQGTLSECLDASLAAPATYNDIKFSAISMDLELLGGTTTLIKETRARILEDLGEIDDPNPYNPAMNKYSGVSFLAKVSWYEVVPGTWVIKLEKV
jgi:uncharacterized protein (UPF0333 family)